jgi:hypothetical protein
VRFGVAGKAGAQLVGANRTQRSSQRDGVAMPSIMMPERVITTRVAGGG